MKSYKNVEEYLQNFKGEENKKILKKLLEIRKLVKSVIPKKMRPNIREEIKYGIPTVVLQEGKKSKNLFHYGGFKTHVSLFPGSAPIKLFQKELKKYETSKGTIKFQLGNKLPSVLIRRILKSIL